MKEYAYEKGKVRVIEKTCSDKRMLEEATKRFIREAQKGKKNA